MPERQLIFVCTGNICRSPMAEYLLRARLPAKTGWRITSAGTFAAIGSPASINGVRVMGELGIDISAHRSRPLTAGMVDEADMVVVMTESHREEVLRMAPGAAGKVHVLKSLSTRPRGMNVADPVGMAEETYREVRDDIDSALPDLILYMHDRYGMREQRN